MQRMVHEERAALNGKTGAQDYKKSLRKNGRRRIKEKARLRAAKASRC